MRFSWSWNKTLQFFGIILFALAIAFFKDYIVKASAVEAQSLQRFQFQAVEKWTSNGNTYLGSLGSYYFIVAAICDTQNGNLIYISGASQSAPAIFSNGCTKNPR